MARTDPLPKVVDTSRPFDLLRTGGLTDVQWCHALRCRSVQAVTAKLFHLRLLSAIEKHHELFVVRTQDVQHIFRNTVVVAIAAVAIKPGLAPIARNFTATKKCHHLFTDLRNKRARHFLGWFTALALLQPQLFSHSLGPIGIICSFLGVIAPKMLRGGHAM